MVIIGSEVFLQFCNTIGGCPAEFRTHPPSPTSAVKTIKKRTEHRGAGSARQIATVLQKPVCDMADQASQLCLLFTPNCVRIIICDDGNLYRW